MWRSLWRSIDRFSLQHFKHVLDELRRIKVVDRNNREAVIDMLQSVVEIVTYGDRHDPMIFEYFMEYQVMAEFFRILKISRNSRIEGPLLQYLSIMIQNIESDHAIYYCFSNGFINSIITHPYKFEGGDLAPYYVSFLRAVSSKLTGDTLCLLVKIDGDNEVSFPLYTEALKFAKHGEKMIHTAVRAITLNIYNVCDDLVYQFVTSPPMSTYFSDLAQSIREQYVHLDSIVHAKEEAVSSDIIRSLRLETDQVVDDLYYFKDLLSVGEYRLKKSVLQNLLNWLVFPALLPLYKLRQQNGPSVITSLYMVAGLLQVVGGEALVNFVAIIVLYPYLVAEITEASTKSTTSKSSNAKSLSSYMSELEGLVCSDSEGGENINGGSSSGQLIGCGTSSNLSLSLSEAVTSTERVGMLSNIISENTTVMLGSLYLLLLLAENKDLDYMFARIINSAVLQETKVIDALLMVLVNQPQVPVLVYWHTGWFLQKLLAFQGRQIGDDSLLVFNKSYAQTCERLQKELEGCWFDYIPDTLAMEWDRCKAVLGEPCERKDPMFLLELMINKQKDNGSPSSSSSSPALWQRMVDTVKVFVLHLQLKAFMLEEDVPEKPLVDLESNPTTTESGKHASDHHSSASFGSEVPLGSAFHCRIAFSNAGVRDIYVVPVAKGKSGKLLLMEKHPFRSQRGVVIAIAPLPGLSPEIDEDHPTWLHLQIREFDPKFDGSKSKSNSRSQSASTNKRDNNKSAVEGRWTLGFSNAEACMAARAMIMEETSKQRSFVELQLAPLLQIATAAPLEQEDDCSSGTETEQGFRA